MSILLDNERENTVISTMRHELDSHKELTTSLTQNLKTVCLSVFLLICCSTFSFLLNVRLRLTFEFLINTSR